VREMIPRGQKEAHMAAVRLPHAAVRETTGARQNCAAMPPVTRGRESKGGIRVRVSSGELRGG
jgi:hypothetical protein